MNRLVAAFLVFVAFVAPGVAESLAVPMPSMSFSPATPIAGQSILVTVRLPFGSCFSGDTINESRGPKSVVLTHVVPFGSTSLTGTCSYQRQISGLQQGEYDVRWIEQFPGDAGITLGAAPLIVVGTGAVPIPTIASWKLLLAIFAATVFLPACRRRLGLV